MGIKIRKTTVNISGMHCASCAANVEKKLRSLPGVIDARVNFAAEQALVSWNPDSLDPSQIDQAIVQAGYKPLPAAAQPFSDPAERQREISVRFLLARLIICVFFSLPLVYISMSEAFGSRTAPFIQSNSSLIQFILATLIIICGFNFFSSGILTLIRNRRANMDTLICIGVGSAYIYSIFASLGLLIPAGADHSPHLYYETSGLIVTFILLGKYLEAAARGRTSSALYKLVNLAPKMSYVLRDGKEILIPSDRIVIGDMIIVKPGGSIGADGIVVEGYSSVDESMVTGESIPVEKSPGKQVITGTLNKTGSFTFEAIKVGGQTLLAQIIKLVQESQGSKAPIQHLADVIAGYFVPFVIIAAAFSMIAWMLAGQSFSFALAVFISVLVIACPCSLGLATPAAVMVATGIAAQRGILIKHAEGLQRAAGIDTVVFDKTGTLTKGAPRVTNIIGYNKSEQEVVCLAASVEKKSEHPLAEAIVKHAEETGCVLKQVRDFVSHPGRGVSANIEGEKIVLGNRRLLEQKNIQIPPKILEDSGKFEAEGKTVMFAAGSARIYGILAVGDTIKDYAQDAVSLLKNMGKRVVMITGDNQRAAKYISRLLSVDDVLAEVLPQDKESEVKNLQGRGRKIAMVGDGINDAPALAQADVGIAIGSGTDIAIESADVVLVRSDPRDVATVIDLSRYALKKIRQNLFWAFFYNIIGIPIAAGALYPFTGFLLNPMVAAAAMAFSSVSVVTNALMMARYKSPELKRFSR
jgi:Cu+-exporting ATPase